MNLEFALASPDSIYELQDLAKTTFTEAFETQNNPDDFNAYLQEAFSKEKLLKELDTHGTEFYMVYVDEILVGYFKINEFDAQTELREPEGLELERIYVKKEFQSKGLGFQMLEKVLQIAKSKAKKYMWLGVWEHNPKAIQFYERYGFVKFDTHPYYIGGDKQTDWLLKKTIEK